MKSVDVIIPMYNSEKYIPGLVRYLEAQNFKDFCAIFVDDGSKDNTYALLEEQLKTVTFAYKLIHQENKGLPGARNTGIRNSEAKWITFLDSDDGIDPNYFTFLLRAVTENAVNVGICDYQMIAREEDAVAVADNAYRCRVIDTQTCMKAYYTTWFGSWVLILNRQWLAEQDLLFDEMCTYLEDVPFITQVIAIAQQVAVVDNCLYLYYKREGSLMLTPKIAKYVIALDGFHRMAEKLKRLPGGAADEFRAVGLARYYLATLRKGATLMPYDLFLELCQHVPMDQAKHQIAKMKWTHRMASRLFLISKKIFYHAMRLATNDR